MKNYTTQTASLKATTVDTRILNTKRLKINGETFNPSDSRIKIWNGIWSDCSLNGGTLQISLYGSLGIYADDWMPHKLFINNKEVMCKTEEGAGAWDFYIAEPNDDFTQLYGGITANTTVTMYYSLI